MKTCTMFVGLLLVLAWSGPAAASAPVSSFDHQTTGFELDGLHRDLPCESCHLNAVFRGTPRNCAACHSVGTRYDATPKLVSHILSSDDCAACHATTSFAPAVHFSHDAVRGSCASCHNNIQAEGKPADHIATTQSCEFCHSTVAWQPAGFDHAGISSGCYSCHNGVAATGKSATHLRTSNLCEYCHNSIAWQPVKAVDHTQIPAAVSGSCIVCHNGVNATGKPATGHVTTSAECGVCHSTLAWTPATFSHAGITGNCASCHDGVAATGKSATHMTTLSDCSLCHNTTAWSPLIFVHTSANYPGDHRTALSCTNSACHGTNSDSVVTWRNAAYADSCAGCHAGNYSSEPHLKYGTTHYTVSELRNCSGACHVYTDATLTTIRTRRNGPQHKVTDSAFGD